MCPPKSAAANPQRPGQALRILRSFESGEKVGVELIRPQKPMSVSLTLPEHKERMRMRTPAPARPASAPAPPANG